MQIEPIQPTLVQRLQAATPIKQMDTPADYEVKVASTMSHTTDLEMSTGDVLAKLKEAQAHPTRPSPAQVMKAYLKASLT